MPASHAPEECCIRRTRPADVNALLRMLREHAEFEGAPAPVTSGQLLHKALFSRRPPLLAWVALLRGGHIGYLSATRDFSTWRCAPFMHMDCLYVDAEHRSKGVGRALMDRLHNFARDQGIAELQWQTPEWNERAAGFYLRSGASESRKRRYVIQIRQEDDRTTTT